MPRRSAPRQLLDAHLLVLAKEPLPGRAKTRLTPPLTPAQAAQVARASLLDTLDVVASVPVRRRTLVLDGTAGAWVPAGVHVLPQREGDLGRRLAGAFADAYAACPTPTLLIGMDTPQVRPALLQAALEVLLSPGVGSVLGPARDGGWWALGLRCGPVPGLFEGVPMSTPRAGAVQRERLVAAGLPPYALPLLGDLDLVGDIAVLAAQQQPGARLAALAAELAAVPRPTCPAGAPAPLPVATRP